MKNKTAGTSRWISLMGVFLFIGLMAGGYYYNLTFVQLGLIDYGQNVLGMERSRVAWYLALLAVLTCLVSITFGWWMNQKGWGKRFLLKLRIASGVVGLQTLLTYLVLRVKTPGGLLLWLLACAAALGIGVPVTFGLTVDLVPRWQRGAAAAWITGLAYLGANLLPSSWTMEAFARPLLGTMPLAAAVLGLIAFLPNPLTKRLARQQRNPSYQQGRYARQANTRLVVLILLMFGVFFTDSLGFLRLLETPQFMQGAWQSSAVEIRLMIGLVHVIAALIGGVLYRALDVRELFLWIFGIFALTHLLYTFQIRIGAEPVPLGMTILYAVTVSLYTVVNFGLWADLSTPETIGLNAALGVSLSGWTATFLSTALAIWMKDTGVSLERHLNITDSVAMLFFLALVVTALFPSDSRRSQR